MVGKKIVTLDFDGRDIRLLIAKRGNVLRWATVTVPKEIMHEGLIKQPDRMGAGLARFLTTHRASKRGVITSATGHRSVSRLITLPAIKSSLLEDAIRRKAKREMPLPLDETYLSWQVVNHENEHLQVYALAVPRLVIDRIVEALRAGKIKSTVMDLKPLALVRVVHKQNAIIVNLEEQSLGVIIVVNGIPRMIRSMPQGSEKSDIDVSLDRLAIELARTTKFYNEGHRDQPLDPEITVYATGAPFDEPETVSKLASKLSHPVEVPQPPMRWPKDFPIATFAVNLGLALKKV